MTDAYVSRMGQISDPWGQKLFHKDGFARDDARKKLQSLYSRNLGR
jgi:hypothetical protein